MSFRIPTLEEARQKHESLSQRSGTVKNVPPSSSSQTKAPTNIRNSSATNNRTSSASSSTSAATTAAPARKRPAVIVNPYAKRTKKIVSSTTTATTTAASTNSYTSTSKRSRAPPACKNPPLLELNANASTFSQGFQSIEHTTQFEKESSKKSNNHDDTDDFDAAQQRAMDAATLLHQANKHHHNTSNAARDNHALLQPHVLHVSTKQRGNRIIEHIRNVPLEYSRMVPDYIMGPNRCALFLSCKYHTLHPSYVHRRLGELGTDFELRILLCLVDMEDNNHVLLFLNRLAVLHNLTLVLAWSDAEAGRYLETFKAYEKKDAASIKVREKETHGERVAHVLAAVRSTNKTDASVLLSQFGNLQSVIAASMDAMSLCPGIGEKKLKRLHDAFHRPFVSRKKKKTNILVAQGGILGTSISKKQSSPETELEKVSESASRDTKKTKELDGVGTVDEEKTCSITVSEQKENDQNKAVIDLGDDVVEI